MTPKPTLRASVHGGADVTTRGPRVVIITLDGHMGGAVAAARDRLSGEIDGLAIGFHAATDWDRDPASLSACLDDIAKADIIFANMLFMEPHITPVLSALQARRDACGAIIGALSSGEVIRLTRAGKLDMGKETGGVLGLLKKLKGSPKKGGQGSGSRQMTMLRRLPKVLRYIPGTAQDLRAYFLVLQYWLGGSDQNLANMIRFLVARYGPQATGAAESGRAAQKPTTAREPIEYPDIGLYHPRLRGRIATRLDTLPHRGPGREGTVGLLVMRSYVLAGDTAHYDGVIAALEAKGLKVVPAFASGLDSRPAIDAYFKDAAGRFVRLNGHKAALLGHDVAARGGPPAHRRSRLVDRLLSRRRPGL